MKNNLSIFHRPSLMRRERTPRLFDMFQEFDDFFRDWGAPAGTGLVEQGWFSPSVDLRETEKEYVFSFDVPGVDEKDIKVTVTGHQLVVSGERKEEKEEKSESIYRSEKSYGQFERRFALPEEVNTDKIEASYNKGVLEVRIPKQEAVQPKSISIKSDKTQKMQ